MPANSHKDVFISHASEDKKDVAEPLAKCLCRYGLSVWYDDREIKIGDRLRGKIEEGLAQSDFGIVILSPNFFMKNWTLRELDGLFATKKDILPIWHNINEETLKDYSPILASIKALNTSQGIDNIAREILAVVTRSKERNIFRYETVKGVLANVPPPPVNFLPRLDYLKRLKEALLSKGYSESSLTGITSVCLQGMGGIGKSVLAAYAVRDPEIQLAFPDGIIWLTIGQAPDLVKKQLQIAKILSQISHSIVDQNEGKNLLSNILQKKKCLLILDDVWEKRQVNAFYISSPNSKILITTRKAEIARTYGSAVISLSTLTRDESVQLLKKWSGRETLPVIADEIIRECNHHPLALAIIGGMLRNRPDSRWIYILDRLKSSNIDKVRQDFLEYPYPSLLNMLDVSVQDLDKENQNRYLQLAIFHEDEPIHENALAMLWGMDLTDSLEIADLFVDQSLAYWDEKGGLLLHDLHRDYVQNKVSNIISIHNNILDAYWCKCNDGWSSGPNDGYFFQNLAYHLNQAGRNLELATLLIDPLWMIARLRYLDIASLLSDYEFVLYDEELRLIQGALRLSANVVERDRTQLRSQLFGRLISRKSKNIQRLLRKLDECSNRPWLKPLNPGLISPDGPLIRTLYGHNDAIWDLAITPDCKRIVSGSSDGIIKIWDFETGTELMELQGHKDMIREIRLSPDTGLAYSCSTDRTVKHWDLETGQLRLDLPIHEQDEKERIWTISPDGYSIITSNGNIIKIWDLKAGNVFRWYQFHTDDINSIALTPDAQHALSCSMDSTVVLWNIESGNIVRTLEPTNKIMHLHVCPDGCKVIAGGWDSRIKLWDIKTGKLLKDLKGHKSPILSVAVTRDGRRAVSCSWDRTVRSWDLENGLEIGILGSHLEQTNVVDLTPDGRYAISGSSDNTVRIWDMQAKCQMSNQKPHMDEIFAIDIIEKDHRLFSGSIDGLINIWDLTDRKIEKTIKRDYKIDALRALDRNHILISGSGRVEFIDTYNNIILNKIDTRYKDITAQIISLGLGHDNSVIVGSLNEDITIWNLNTSEFQKALCGHVDSVSSLAIPENGRIMISGSWDNSLRVWEMYSWEELMVLNGHKRGVSSVAVTPDGRIAVSGSSDQTIRVWDLIEGREVLKLEGHFDRVNAVAITTDGRFAISGSNDKTLRVWNLINGEIMAAFSADAYISACSILSDNKTIIAGDTLGFMHFLYLELEPHKSKLRRLMNKMTSLDIFAKKIMLR